MAFVKVAKKADIPEGTGTTVSVDGTEIALFNVGGAFYAINNTCAHRGGPLGEGMLEGNVVTCPWHGWTYDVTAGKSTLNQAQVPAYKVKVEGDDILVSLE